MSVNFQIFKFKGLAVSASYSIFANWIPPKERSRLINFVALGVPMGTLIGYPMSGYISHLLNWRYVFYITGNFVNTRCVWIGKLEEIRLYNFLLFRYYFSGLVYFMDYYGA